MKPRYITDIRQIAQLTPREKAALTRVSERFRFLTNDYYLSLIDWNDPHDPIRRIIIPSSEELHEWGRLDASDEHAYTVMPGVQHKYNSTVLLLVSNACGGICRYCFRKRIFIHEGSDCLRDLRAAIDYIKNHTEVTNVLLTGGDALALSTERLEEIISLLREIEHVRVIRIGTKLLSYDVFRVLSDSSLPKMIEKHSTDTKKIYIMNHFCHPREITDLAIKAVNILQRTGAVLTNQCPMVRGVNDDPHTLAELFRELSFLGIPPYYVFQCRPSAGNMAYAVPVEEGYHIFESAKSMVSGLAKRARYVMSHSSGKIEIVGVNDGYIYLKYHRAAHSTDSSRFMVFRSNPNACWFDDYDTIEESFWDENRLGFVS
jgi:KamA family protein